MKVKKNLRIKIGLFLRSARKDNSLTTKELGRLVGVSQQQISRYELGTTSMNIETLDLFLTTLDKTWENFLCNVVGYNDMNFIDENS